MGDTKIRIMFVFEDTAIVRECAFLPDVGDVVDIPLVDGSTKSPMMGYKVVEKRWVVPVEWRDMEVVLKLEPYEAVFRSHYVEAGRRTVSEKLERDASCRAKSRT